MNEPRVSLAPASAYLVPPGAELVKLRDLTAAHRSRFIETRTPDGDGYVDRLSDANHYLFDELVAIRHASQKTGVFASPDDVVLVHPPGITLEAITAYYADRGGTR